MSISDLAQFRETRTTAPKEGGGPVRPVFPGRILAVDQSISNTGWALIERTGGISATGNIKTEQGPVKGHEDTLTRGTEVFSRYLTLISSLKPDLIVHETPPVGGKMMRPESSLVSAAALRHAALVHQVPIRMIGAQKAKKRWTGNGNAEKALVKEAIRRLDPMVAQRKPLNEGIYDAIAIGWVACEEER
jgi:Holliday junction resolvasome RuvABC endonuclease subunit